MSKSSATTFHHSLFNFQIFQESYLLLLIFLWSIIFPLIPLFTIVDRKDTKTYQVYYTILLTPHYYIHFNCEAHFLSSKTTSITNFQRTYLISIYLVWKKLYSLVLKTFFIIQLFSGKFTSRSRLLRIEIFQESSFFRVQVF